MRNLAFVFSVLAMVAVFGCNKKSEQAAAPVTQSEPMAAQQAMPTEQQAAIPEQAAPGAEQAPAAEQK